ncbi:hypothetical protein [Rhodococcus sp. NPDC003348]
MDTAQLALAVAGTSLAWNIISTVVTWRRAGARVRATYDGVTYGVDNDSYVIGRLHVSLVNTGARDVSVTGLKLLLVPFIAANRSQQSLLGWSARRNKAARFGQALSSRRSHESMSRGWLSGPEFPVTIEPLHSGQWEIDMSYLAGLENRVPPYTLTCTFTLGSQKDVQVDIPMAQRDHASAIELTKERATGQRRQIKLQTAKPPAADRMR